MEIFDTGMLLLLHSYCYYYCNLWMHFITPLSILSQGITPHHCILYSKVGWPSLKNKKGGILVIIDIQGYSILEKLPSYITSLLQWKASSLHTHTSSACT